jgi:hypothetical protein
MSHRFARPPPRIASAIVQFPSGYVPPFRAASAHLSVNDRVEAYSTKIRPTDLCHPNQPVYLHPRSWLPSYLSSSRDEPRGRDGSRDTTFHDVVARFGRIVTLRTPVVRRGSFVRSSL